MNATAEKGRETRRKNEEIRARLWEEQRAATATARKGLLRVMEDENSTPAEILEAARLLTELGKY